MAGHGDQLEPEAARAELRARLEDATASTDLSKTQLAQRAKLGRTTVQEAFSSDKPVPSHRTVASLARALKLPVDELLELRRIAAAEPDPRAAPTPPAPSPEPGRRVWRRHLKLGVPIVVLVAGASVIAITLGPRWFSPPDEDKGRPKEARPAGSPTADKRSASDEPSRSSSRDKEKPAPPDSGRSSPAAKPKPEPTSDSAPEKPSSSRLLSLKDKARLKNLSTSKCVYDDGTNPSVGACSASETYEWTLKPDNGTFMLVNTATGECLSSSNTNNNQARVSSCVGYDDSLRWTIGTTTSTGQTLKNKHTGWCLKIETPDFSPFPQVLTATCNSDERRQLWKNGAPS